MRPRILHLSVFVWFVLSGGRFTATFLESVANFSDTENGLALALQVALETVLAPFAGTLADSLERRNPRRGRAFVLVCGVGLGTIAFMLHGVVKWAASDVNSVLTTLCHMSLRVMFSCGNAFVYPVLNGITLAYLNEEGSDPANYGKERLYGAVGWALASVAVGPFIDYFGFYVLIAFSPASAAFCFSTIHLYVRGIESAAPQQEESRDDVEEDGLEESPGGESTFANESNESHEMSESTDKHRSLITQENRSKDNGAMLSLLKAACGTLYGVGFIFSLITLRMGTSIVESLIFLFFEELGGSNTLMGLTVAVTVLFEIPIFQLAPLLLQRFGVGALQQVACAAYITRVVGYTFIPDGHTWLVLFLEPLHGVTYGCTATSSVEYFAQLTSKGQEASGQGLLSALTGIGSIVGLSVGGWAEDNLGAKVMYRGFAGVAGVGLLVFCITDACKIRYQRLHAADSEDDKSSTCNNVELSKLSRAQETESR